MTPSTMSAATATYGRPRVRTATTHQSSERRMVRSIPGTRGGLRNDGALRPRARAARPSARAASANCKVEAVSTPSTLHEGCIGVPEP